MLLPHKAEDVSKVVQDDLCVADTVTQNGGLSPRRNPQLQGAGQDVAPRPKPQRGSGGHVHEDPQGL